MKANYYGSGLNRFSSLRHEKQNSQCLKWTFVCIIVEYCASVLLPSLTNKCFDSSWPGLALGCTNFSMCSSFRNMIQSCPSSSPISRLHPPFYLFDSEIGNSIDRWSISTSTHSTQINVLQLILTLNQWTYYSTCFQNQSFISCDLLLRKCKSFFLFSSFYSHQPPLNVHKICSRFLRPIRGFNSV